MTRLRLARLAACLGLAVSLGSGTARADARTYRIDPRQSQLTIQVLKGGALSAFGHDHLFVPQRFSGQISFDPYSLDRTRLQLTVPADSLRDHEPGLSDSDRAKVEAQTRDKVLEARRFPTIVVTTQSLALDLPPERTPAGLEIHGVLVGTIRLHGVTRPLRIPVQATASDGVIKGIGGVALSLKEFGIKPVSAALGAVSVKDEVQVSLELVARSQAASPQSGKATD